MVSFASLPFETEYAEVGIYFLVSDLFLVPASFVCVAEEFLDLLFVQGSCFGFVEAEEQLFCRLFDFILVLLVVVVVGGGSGECEVGVGKLLSLFIGGPMSSESCFGSWLALAASHLIILSYHIT